ncbi:MAG: ArsA family ATPase [Candidatus Edwardsbacteria bacterium]
MKISEKRRLIIFGGKGGCGKTTSATATGLYLAQHYPKQRILIVSCDPAHSVGDSLGYTVGNTITPIKDLNNLWALEIKAEEEASLFKKKYDLVMKKIVERGTYFDRQDIENFFSLSIPGLDEIMAVIKIANILREEKYDLIILDTAPTGHTIRLLGLPLQMKKWVEVLDLMQSKHRFLASHFAGKYKKDDADEFLEMVKSDVDRVSRLLKNRDSTEFIPVTKPETLAIEETERLLAILKGYGISVKSIIVNQIKSSQNRCPFCSKEEKEQKKELDIIRQKFANLELHQIPIFPYQIRGMDRLKEYAQVLFEEKPHRLPIGKKPFDFKSKIFSIIKLPQLIEKGIILYIFGGKGGVGKTSIASATALSMAKKYPSKKVLVFSTDPAHSLSDSFGLSIGDNLTQIGGLSPKETVPNNLFALEIDALKLLENFKKDYKDQISEVFSKFIGGGVDVKFDREILEELISLTPPGLDEIMALAKVVEFIDGGKFDIYILDSAATGHLLRFLEMPQVAREWLNAIFKLLIKYKGIVRLAKQAEEMIEFSKKVRKIQEILTDPARCQFVVVGIPEAMGKSEMDGLLENLKRLNIPSHYILVNMILPKTRCNFCESKRGEQIKIIQEIERERSSQYQIGQLPLFPYQIKGIDRLKDFSKEIYG